MIDEPVAHRQPECVAYGIRRVISATYGSMLWTLGSARKLSACALCNRAIVIGASQWRPMSFGDWRMHRICTHCWPIQEGAK